MRVLLILAVAVIPAVAQNPVVRLTNATRPASGDFQIGDLFEIVITAAANQPVSVQLTGLTTASIYSVSVTAVDTSGNESACSDVASAIAQDDSATTPITQDGSVSTPVAQDGSATIPKNFCPPGQAKKGRC